MALAFFEKCEGTLFLTAVDKSTLERLLFDI